MDKEFKTKICENYQKNVGKRLRIEGTGNETISNPSAIDNKNNSNINLLPFSCQYTIQQGNNNSRYQVISIELNPLFTELTDGIKDEFEEEIDLKQVCKHETVIEQMEKQAEKQGFYHKNRGDNIIPIIPVFLQSKKDVYPVFRWVCSYNIKKKVEEERFKERDTHYIDK